MSMGTGATGKGLENEINVTPMIDVLLVLLIIFMAALPSMRKAIDIQLPDPNPQQTATPPSTAACSRSTPRRWTSRGSGPG
jgi:biopolymer transport protein ExbD